MKIQEEKIKKAEAESRKERVITEAETDAEVKIINVKADEEAVRRMAYANAETIRAEGLARADVMKAQGYSYSQETQRQVGVAIANNEGNGTMGTIGSAMSGAVQAGVGIGAAVSIGKTTANMMNDVMKNNNENSFWTCPNCGETGNDGKFCKNCGCKRIETQGWKCPNCGEENNDGNFCKNCGCKRG